MYAEAKKYFVYLAYAISFVGFFFTSWILLESDKLNPLKEMFFSFIASGITIFIIIKISKFIRTSTNKHITLIRELFTFIHIEADEKGYINPSKRREYVKRRTELVEKAVRDE